MSREKQIEEMARDICECFNNDGTCYQDDKLCDCKCDSFTDAQYLYEKGYRKQSENTVEVVRCKDCEYWTEVSFDAITEWHWGECRKPLGDYRDCDTAEHDFCSYGEAKMKGGAE